MDSWLTTKGATIALPPRVGTHHRDRFWWSADVTDGASGTDAATRAIRRPGISIRGAAA